MPPTAATIGWGEPLDRRSRRVMCMLCGVCLVAAAALAVLVHGSNGPVRIDRFVDARVPMLSFRAARRLHRAGNAGGFACAVLSLAGLA